ncbi:MAG: porphobilinogen synthase [Candidatus Dadabacteria bacterium]|nr:porphobilinogen synthase [Candidatus Dadabacteria bacterium]
MSFPITRLRRLRRSKQFRDLVKETQLHTGDLVYPMFVVPGTGVREEIGSMPGIFRRSIDLTVEEVKEARDLGLRAVLLFGIPEEKDDVGSGGYDEDGIVQRALREIKSEIDDVLMITDVCMCEYTSHGHCGIIKDGTVDNDETLTLLAQTSLSHAKAGADMVAPSDMMDGRVGAIREMLDVGGYPDIPIMSYSAKYASAFYGPFRKAADSTPEFGDRRGYQMDPSNVREAIREIELDIEEGADIIMVKPALSYLDVIRAAREEFDHPLAAYNVSGEYSMVKAAGMQGLIDEQRVMMEILTSIKRAGAEIIITYHAKEAAKILGGLD